MAFAAATSLALVLLVVGLAIGSQFHVEGYAWNVDSYAYIRALIYGPSVVFVPYKFRLLTPFLGSVVWHTTGMEPYQSLAIVSVLSLFAFYLVVFATCFKVTEGILPSSLGLIAIYLTYAHHHWYYRMPAMLDSSVALVVAVALYAMVTRNWWLFMASITVGAFVHEYLLFISPAWFFVDRSKAIKWLVPILSSVFFYAAIRTVFNGGTYGGVTVLALADYGKDRLRYPGKFAREVLLVWGMLFPILGIVLYRFRTYRWQLGGMFGLLMAGSLIASMMAQTIDRFLWWQAPVFAVCVAITVAEVSRCGRLAQRPY